MISDRSSLSFEEHVGAVSLINADLFWVSSNFFSVKHKILAILLRSRATYCPLKWDAETKNHPKILL